MNASHFSSDIREFIVLLSKHGVRYMIVGGEAVIYYGHARLTGDVDFFYDINPDNPERLFSALNEFWNGSIPGITGYKDFTKSGDIFQFGKAPNRIDLINKIDGVDFVTAWNNKILETFEYNDRIIPLNIIGLKELIKNKEASARFKDFEDLKYLKPL